MTARAPLGGTGDINRPALDEDETPIGQGWLKNISHLVSGNMVNALLMLASTTIAARSLGPSAFGVLALVLTVGRLSERLLRFESWQPLIRFVAHEETSASPGGNARGNPERIAQLYLYGLMLDIATALAAGVLTILLGYGLMGLIGFNEADLPLVAIYAAAIATNIRGMPTAALRLDGKFRTLAYIQILASLLRLGLALGALLLGLPLLAFILIWTFCQMLDSALFLWLGLRAIRAKGIPSPLAASPRGLKRKFPGFMAFAWSTNVSSTLRTLTQEADTLLVSAFAGTAWAGFYHIAKRIAKVAQQVGAMMQAVIYPDMARMWSRRDIATFRSTIRRVQSVLAAAALGLLLLAWVLGDWLIQTAFGPDYAGTYPLLLAQLIAVALIMHAAPSRSALLAMDRAGLVLAVALASTLLFFLTALAAMPVYGALGANIAHIAFGALTALAMDIAMWRQIRATDDAAPEASRR